ncbi:27038_t:CDS:2 [Dentiscutata erythropus]|uniref:27038_t:CDS:1 n=1 Tax=Dentiscutata erythropus TaxID=1348616 RepID=A0A9N8YYQ8_9GLOM|nr:27038_t:CDS:2 [Dentiscutata erythropus]
MPKFGFSILAIQTLSARLLDYILNLFTIPRVCNIQAILDSIVNSDSEYVRTSLTAPISTQRKDIRRRQGDGKESIETEPGIEGGSEDIAIDKNLGKLNLGNHQSTSEEDIEEIIELLFLPKKKCRMHSKFQDSMNKSSDEEEFEKIDEELNDKLVKKFNEESDKESNEEAEEIEELMKESDNELDEEELDKRSAKEKIYSDSNEFEDYSAPNIDNNNQTRFNPNVNQPLEYEWILLWLLKFQSRFNLSEAAIDTLIKFIYIILVEIGGKIHFGHYPNSIHMVRKYFKIGKNFMKYVTYPNCSKLYRKDDVVSSQNNKKELEIKKCNHIEFLNIIGTRQKKTCNSALAVQKKYLKEIKNEAILLFLDGVISDIYNSHVWKEFEDKPSNSGQFFIHETADSHFGLLLNLDWFQPFA